MKLTPKQKIFVNEYLVDFNATRAYKVAYASCKKDGTARCNGSKLLAKANVREYISKRMEKREKRTEITQDKVLRELAKIGFADITDYVKIIEKSYMREGKKISYKDIEIEETKDIDTEKLGAISSIKQGVNGIEIKLSDKVRALEQIGRHLGMFNDRLELNGKVNNEVNITIDGDDFGD